MNRKSLDRFKTMFEAYLTQFGKMGVRPKLQGVLEFEACGDSMDYAAASHEWHITTRLFEKESSVLRAVKSALLRIAAGTFGVCQECGGSIGEERLQARPTTALCIHCQSSIESKGTVKKSRRTPMRQRKVRLTVLPVECIA